MTDKPQREMSEMPKEIWVSSFGVEYDNVATATLSLESGSTKYTRLDLSFTGYTGLLNENRQLHKQLVEMAGINAALQMKEKPTQSVWQQLDEWHEDFGDCLFMFFHNGHYYGGEFTSPLSSAWGKEYDFGWQNQIVFQRIDTYHMPLPIPTVEDK